MNNLYLLHFHKEDYKDLYTSYIIKKNNDTWIVILFIYLPWQQIIQ